MDFKLKHSCSLFIVLLHFAGGFSSSFEEDIALTEKEAKVLFKFQERVRSKLPHRHMEENIFLIKWLRARNFDIDAAEQMLLKHLTWRAENRVDNIDEEDWQEFQRDYPWNLAGEDMEGRPLVQIQMKDWDIRQAAITGRLGQLTRWLYKYFEDGSKQVRKLQETGKNITRFSVVMDAEGFNAVTHGCPICMPLYFQISNVYEQHYPGSVDSMHIVNTPEIFRSIIRLLWPVLSKDTQKSLKIHGVDKKNWRNTLLKSIDNSQLLPFLGGSLKI